MTMPACSKVAAFVADAMAFLASVHPDAAQGSPADAYGAEVASIEVEGDRAVVRFRDVADRVQLAKRDDRWYLHLIPPGY